MKYLIVPIISLMFFSCSNHESKENDLAKENLKGKVKSIREVTFEGIDKLGEIQIGKIINEGKYLIFNEDGNLMKESDFDGKSILIYSYDDKKLLKEKSLYAAYLDSSLEWETIFHYNENGLINEKVSYDNNKSIAFKVSYKYNNNNQLVEENDTYPPWKNGEGMIWSINGKTYPLSKIVYKLQYDSNRKLAQESLQNQCLDTLTSSVILDSITVTYTYNDKGKKVEQYRKYENGFFEKTTYHYNETGLLDEEDYSSNLDKQHDNLVTSGHVFKDRDLILAQSKQIKYYYDGNTNKIEEQILYNGNGYNINKYEYDKNGNWIKLIEDRGSEKNITEREITYYNEKENKSQLDSIIQEKKNQELRDNSCNTKAAEDEVKAWMEETYPDWKIISDFNVTEADDCVYNVEFTVVNPYFAAINTIKKEIIIIQFQYAESDFSKVNFKISRGNLY